MTLSRWRLRGEWRSTIRDRARKDRRGDDRAGDGGGPGQEPRGRRRPAEAKEEKCATEVKHIDWGEGVRQWQGGLRLRGEALQAGRFGEDADGRASLRRDRARLELE